MHRILVLLVLAAALVAVGPAAAWTWPTDGPVLLPFSFDPAHPYAGGQHRGVDVGGEPGESVLAPASGVVTFRAAASR
jgi:murein DD-endopeptidase MepM/ murein hydrolase activator NlpD